MSMVVYTRMNNTFIRFFIFVGFNNFMEDIRMMLDKRPLEPYWFFTWCISGPIITFVSNEFSIDIFDEISSFEDNCNFIISKISRSNGR